MTRVLHVLDHSLPLHSGYTFRTRAILKAQQAAGLEVRVDPTPVKLDGFSVRLTIPIKSTDGAVTAVPMSALSLAADGSSRVQVQE